MRRESKRAGRSGVVVLTFALMAFTSAPALGQAPSNWSSWTSMFAGSYTGGSSFATTMAVDLRYIVSGGTYFVGLDIANLGSVGEVFTRVGLVNLGGSVVSKVSANGWGTQSQSAFGGAGLPSNTWAWTAPVPRPTYGLQNGESTFFLFEFKGTPSIAQIGAGVHAQVGPNGCSTKFAVWPDGSGGLATNDITNGGTTPTCGAPVPEPTSMALLATGLGSLAFVARRRRSEVELVDEDGDPIEA